MNERKELQERRLSLRQLTEKAERHIYKHLSMHSQPAELTPSQQADVQLSKFSEPQEFLPLGCVLSNLQSLRSYKSQKYLQLAARQSSQDASIDTPKKFTINTISLKQLQPIRDKCLSLPRIKKKSPPRAAGRNAELQWITPQEMMAKKLRISKKQLPKIKKEVSQVYLEKLRNAICGWMIEDYSPHDFLD